MRSANRSGETDMWSLDWSEFHLLYVRLHIVPTENVDPLSYFFSEVPHCRNFYSAPFRSDNTYVRPMCTVKTRHNIVGKALQTTYVTILSIYPVPVRCLANVPLSLRLGRRRG